VIEPAAIAQELLLAWDRADLLPPVTARDPEFSWLDAYAIAAKHVQLRRARGERTVGRKIGFTNRSIWAQYNATSPIWAHVYDTTLIPARDNHANLSLRGSVAPRIEPEIAFGLNAPVPPGCKTPEEVLRCVAWFAPAFEIVDCHYPGWKFAGPDAPADFSLHWRLIVGAPQTVDARAVESLARQLHDCTVVLDRNGTVADRGTGANALDHPALAVAFLADLLAAQPQFDPLAAGEVITTGTLTAALPVAAGETWTSRFDGIGLAPQSLTFS
jgi:2-oxo-3-hexenedioate decarboxylase